MLRGLMQINTSEPLTVFLVDDNEAVLSRAEAALSARCVVVGTARDGSARSKQPQH